ncbi:MAG: 2-hydroxychromene-2-carboxylate isomerase [Nannocystaceae bacterium]
MQFFFDVISPYAYLAWKRIGPLAAACGRAWVATPVLFAAMLDAWGHKGPAEIGPKRVYTFKHVVRLAARQRVPLQPPPHHPFNPLLALRVATAAAGEPAVIDALFDAVWATGVGVQDEASIATVLAARGLPAAALLQAAASPAIKAALRQATDDAIARGVFGVPTVIVDGELFWGQDALDDVAAFVRGEDPAQAAAARWRDLSPSATRPRA